MPERGPRSRALLVGLFRSFVPEGADSPFGSQGGFGDTLAPTPYSLANAYLKAFAEADPTVRAAWDIELLNLAEPLELEDEREEMRLRPEDVAAILAREPDLVAFSSYCWNLDAVRAASVALRRARPELVILVGGRGPEGDPEGLVAEMPAVDGAIFGEGELPLREILRRGGRDLAGIPGVVHRAGAEIRRGGPAVAVDDLDEIPSPYQLGLIDPPPHGVMLELTRGCLHGCGYCTWNADKRLRWFGPERVEADIRWALENGHRHVTLADSAVNYDTERMRQTVAAIRRADPAGEVHFTYNVRHDAVTPEQLDILRDLPTHMVLLGVETLGADGMSAVDREPVDLAALRASLVNIGRATRPPMASIVLGLPGDTEEGFRETLDTLLSWTRPEGDEPPAVGTVLVSLLQVYRGSKLWERRGELGLRCRESGIPYLLESPTWPAAALARAKRYLLARLAEDPERLKAAEGIVMAESEGGIDPWLTRRRVEALLRPWRPGMTLEGWTLERVGVVRDTGQAVGLRMRWRDGGGFRVRLHKRDGHGPARLGTARYALDLRPLSGPPAPPAARAVLERLVLSALRRGERAAAAAAARRAAR